MHVLAGSPTRLWRSVRVWTARERRGRSQQATNRLYDQWETSSTSPTSTLQRTASASTLVARTGQTGRKISNPPELCKAIVKAAEKDKITQMVCLGMEDFNESWAEGDDGGIDPEELIDQAQEREAEQDRILELQPAGADDEEEEDQEDPVIPSGVTRKEKGLLQRLHVNLGHPSKEDFYRALKMSRARPEVLKYVKKEFACDHCTQHQNPKSARPSTIPKGYTPNRVVGIDTVFFPGINPRDQKPVLNIIDWGTCYQMLEPVPDMQSSSIWNSFVKSWLRTFGMPEMIVMDQGREFIGVFSQRAAEYGALVRTIGARAPWQNGRTERHGGLAKGTFIKAGNQVGLTTQAEWDECLRSVEAAKNRLFHPSGFSPAQRQLGQNLRLPGSLASDDPFEVGLIQGSAGRTLEIRQAALESFLRYSTEASAKKAAYGRSRGSRHFNAGKIVYVFRKPWQDAGQRLPAIELAGAALGL